MISGVYFEENGEGRVEKGKGGERER